MSAYELLPGFISVEHGSSTMTNGWNTHLEAMLIDIQTDSNMYFAMLTETAQKIVFWKWVFIVTIAVLASTGAIITTVALSLGVDGIWLPIVNAAIAALGALGIVIMEALEMNEWVSDCKSHAADFIKLGRHIEAEKRVPPAERSDSGANFTNLMSMEFEELRKNVDVPAWIQKKYARSQMNKRYSLTHVTVPIELLHATTSIPLDEVVVENSEGENERPQLSSSSSSSNTPPTNATPPTSLSQPSPPVKTYVTFQELLEDRLRLAQSHREEQDELEHYENYVRNQYSGLGARLNKQTL